MTEIKKLTKSQRGYLQEIKQKHNRAFTAEFNQALQDVIEEMGLTADLKSDKVQVQLSRDYSIMNIIRPTPPPPPDDPKPEEEKK